MLRKSEYLPSSEMKRSDLRLIVPGNAEGLLLEIDKMRVIFKHVNRIIDYNPVLPGNNEKNIRILYEILKMNYIFVIINYHC